MILDVQSGFPALAIGSLLLSGCSEACGCTNNARPVRIWAECASGEIGKTGHTDFARRYIGLISRDQPVTATDRDEWARVSRQIEKTCGAFATAVDRAKADAAAGRNEDNVEIALTAVDALAVHGLIDQPTLTVQSKAGTQ